MSDRDELIKQAFKTMEECTGLACTARTSHIGALIDTGWRPRPSGDVVEQVRTIIRNETGPCGDGLAEFLAAGGFLAHE